LGYDDTKNQITLVGGYQEDLGKSIFELSIKEVPEAINYSITDSNDILSGSFENICPKVLADMIRKVGHLECEPDKEMPLAIQTLTDSYRWDSSSSIVMNDFDFASQHGIIMSRNSSARKSNKEKGIAELKRHESYRRVQPLQPQPSIPRARSYSLELGRSNNLRIDLLKINEFLDKVTETDTPRI
jgi:hypothetical protein